MITEQQLDDALTFIKKHAVDYAKAKADRRYLEEFRKTVRARLFINAPKSCKTVADREAWAYAHPDYESNLLGIQVAVEEEERLKWQLEAAKIQCEIYRTQSANNRAMDRSAR
jgi:hypothetical protein